MTDLWTYEAEARAAGFSLICGVDEAGAGPLMGPVYAAAVILPENCDLPGLNDSKKLTEKKREALFPLIQEQALAWSVASVSAREIDDTDILSARMKAMQLAIDGPTASSSAATACPPPSRRPPCWPRSAVTTTSPMCWIRNTPSTASPSTRATARPCTVPCWTSTVPAPNTA